MYDFTQDTFISAIKNSASNLKEITVSFLTGGSSQYVAGDIVFPTKRTREFVKSRLTWLSTFAGVGFKFVEDNNAEANIPIAIVTKLYDDRPNVAGFVVGSDERLIILASRFNTTQYNPVSEWVMIHELGHAVGLSHPNDRTDETNITTDTTVMSYYPREFGSYPSFFTDQDLLNLREIWGLGEGAIVGTDSNDTLTGTDSYDVIIGGKGSDTLIGGGGADLLIGQKGKDTYLLSKDGAGSGTNIDLINGFTEKDTVSIDGKFEEKRLKFNLRGDDTIVSYKGDIIGIINNYRMPDLLPMPDPLLANSAPIVEEPRIASSI